jgi:hypothetical protein
MKKWYKSTKNRNRGLSILQHREVIMSDETDRIFNEIRNRNARIPTDPTEVRVAARHELGNMEALARRIAELLKDRGYPTNGLRRAKYNPLGKMPAWVLEHYQGAHADVWYVTVEGEIVFYESIYDSGYGGSTRQTLHEHFGSMIDQGLPAAVYQPRDICKMLLSFVQELEAM